MNLPQIAEQWQEPSVLDGHTVGSLAAHLARAVFTVQRYLEAPAGVGEPTTAAGYLMAVLGDADPIDSDLRSRIVELVIHLDDVCLSVGTEPPEDMGAAFDITAAVLGQVALRRTGPWATLRSLARSERHPAAVRAL